jgi:hypothetical protein
MHARALHHLLSYEEVGACRKLDCEKYDRCLEEVCAQHCISWKCLPKCRGYTPAPPAEVPGRVGEQDCSVALSTGGD